MPRVHELKTHPGPFEAQLRGDKAFEFRWNDRDYQVGDELLLREWDPKERVYTGRKLLRAVTYMLVGGPAAYGVPQGFAVLATQPSPRGTCGDPDCWCATTDLPPELAALLRDVARREIGPLIAGRAAAALAKRGHR